MNYHSIGKQRYCTICGTAFTKEHYKQVTCKTKKPRCSIILERERVTEGNKIHQANKRRIVELEFQLVRCKNFLTDEQLIEIGL